MAARNRFAFYDLDGTLVSSNVVNQYVWYVRQLPSRGRSRAKLARLLVKAPVLAALELYSRTRFNEVFFREYRGLERDWLRRQADGLLEEVFQPALFPGARELVARDRDAGFQTVLVTGSLDFALGPLVRYFGFDRVIANRLVFAGGVATGELQRPLIAEAEKVAAIEALAREYNVETAHSKAYSDSMSDLPMLEAVGLPVVVNPGRRLRRIAEQKGWPALILK